MKFTQHVGSIVLPKVRPILTQQWDHFHSIAWSLLTALLTQCIVNLTQQMIDFHFIAGLYNLWFSTQLWVLYFTKIVENSLPAARYHEYIYIRSYLSIYRLTWTMDIFQYIGKYRQHFPIHGNIKCDIFKQYWPRLGAISVRIGTEVVRLAQGRSPGAIANHRVPIRTDMAPNRG